MGSNKKQEALFDLRIRHGQSAANVSHLPDSLVTITELVARGSLYRKVAIETLSDNLGIRLMRGISLCTCARDGDTSSWHRHLA